jgi:hypothetical protein
MPSKMEKYDGKPSKYAGKKVKIISGKYKGADYVIEDWQPIVFGQSWFYCNGNPACLKYAMRAGMEDNLPTDNNVYYGKIGAFGEIIHASEIEAPDAN